MKLDKMKFAAVIAYISNIISREMIEGIDIQVLDDLIDVQMPAEPGKANPEEVERLMALMCSGHSKIEAIKSFRNLTGMGLKESKDAVERHWVAKD